MINRDSSQGALAQTALWTKSAQVPGFEGPSACVSHPTGQYIAVGLQDGTLINCDSSGRELWRAQRHTGKITEIQWSPDGIAIASAASDGTLRLWEGSTGRPLQLLAGHQGNNHHLAWSPDGRMIAAGSGYCASSKAYDVGLWRIAGGRRLPATAPHQSPITALVYLLPSGHLATGTEDGAVFLWAAMDNKCLAHMPKRQSPVITISPLGQERLLLAYEDGFLQIWCPLLDQVIAETTCPEPIKEASATATGDLIFCRSQSGRAYQWDPAMGEQPIVLKLDKDCSLISISPNGSSLICLDKLGQLILYSQELGESLTHTGHAANAERDRHILRLASALQCTSPLADASNWFKGCADDFLAVRAAGVHAPLNLIQALLLGLCDEREDQLPERLRRHQIWRSLRHLQWSRAAYRSIVAALLGRLRLQLWEHPHLDAFEIAQGLHERGSTLNFAGNIPTPFLKPLLAGLSAFPNRLLPLFRTLDAHSFTEQPALALALLQSLSTSPSTAPGRTGNTPGFHDDSPLSRKNRGIGSHDIALTRVATPKALMPSELALDADYLLFRILSRKALGHRPSAHLRPSAEPAVIVLDCSPPCWGLPGLTLQLAAYILCRQRQLQQVPFYLIAAGGQPTLLDTQSLAALFNHRNWAGIDVEQTLNMARALRSRLNQGPTQPQSNILWLSHQYSSRNLQHHRCRGVHALLVTLDKLHSTALSDQWFDGVCRVNSGDWAAILPSTQNLQRSTQNWNDGELELPQSRTVITSPT